MSSESASVSARAVNGCIAAIDRSTSGMQAS
jgi:hypothetical protein